MIPPRVHNKNPRTVIRGKAAGSLQAKAKETRGICQFGVAALRRRRNRLCGAPHDRLGRERTCRARRNCAGGHGARLYPARRGISRSASGLQAGLSIFDAVIPAKLLRLVCDTAAVRARGVTPLSCGRWSSKVRGSRVRAKAPSPRGRGFARRCLANVFRRFDDDHELSHAWLVMSTANADRPPLSAPGSGEKSVRWWVNILLLSLQAHRLPVKMPCCCQNKKRSRGAQNITAEWRIISTGIQAELLRIKDRIINGNQCNRSNQS